MDIASQFFMASFDVENLFTNIPLTETIEICLNCLFTDPRSLIISLPGKIFKTLLEFSVTNSFSTFNKRFISRLMYWAWGHRWVQHSLIFSCASMNHLGFLIVSLNSVRFFIDGTSMILFCFFIARNIQPVS